MTESMEQGLIRFAKVHGCINAFLLGCNGISPLAVDQDWNDVVNPVVITIIILFFINSLLLFVGCIREDARWLKPTITENNITYDMVSIIVSFYGIYIVRFLEKLFNTLQLHRAGNVAITAIVCEDPPTVPSQQPVRPGLPDGLVRPPSPSAAATTNTTAALKLKEFPTGK